MSVANLTRYKIMKLIDGAIMHPRGNDDVVEYVKFEEVVEALEASSNSLQQLKAEIAAIVDEHFFTNENGTSCSGKYGAIAERLRQLSAV